MKRLVLIFLFSSSIGLLYGQSEPHREVVGSSGGEFQSNQEIVQFTIGEAVIDFFTDTSQNIQLTQGFHQSYVVVRLVKSIPLCELKLSIWPNPSSRYVHIEVGKDIVVENVECFLYMPNGVRIDRFNLIENSEIDLAEYHLNSLILQIIDNKSGCHQVFKVIKN
ncbi:MAG: hypothetical protein CL840_01870 [Crocinitomicaceae bacterium]|nr:hypothetical protein [Crocinitomicaceae bacterium]|tara:strand:+ start:4820 stop:5314 length:495 start_codon:yes stop_codon:yes gene_type:complete